MSEKLPKLLLFCGADPLSVGQIENFLNAVRTGKVGANVVGLVSTDSDGVIRHMAKALSNQKGERFPFYEWPSQRTGESYTEILKTVEADVDGFTGSIGWPLPIRGLDAQKTFSLKPDSREMCDHLSDRPFEIATIGFSTGHLSALHLIMRFLVEPKDGEIMNQGVPFFRKDLNIKGNEKPLDLEQAYKEILYHHQPIMADAIMRGNVWWDGKDPLTVRGSIVVTNGNH